MTLKYAESKINTVSPVMVFTMLFFENMSNFYLIANKEFAISESEPSG